MSARAADVSDGSIVRGWKRPSVSSAARGVSVAMAAGRASADLSHAFLRTELNFSILRLNFSISSGIFTKISQNFTDFLKFSMNFNILGHVR